MDFKKTQNKVFKSSEALTLKQKAKLLKHLISEQQVMFDVETNLKKQN